MKRYSSEFITKVQQLRKEGKTYTQINQTIKSSIPKSTLSEWLKNIPTPDSYRENLKQLNSQHLNNARKKALTVNRLKRKFFLNQLHKNNLPISQLITNSGTAKIALAMLCLGEASKYSSGSKAFTLGNSDPKIIIFFLKLLHKCFDFKIEKVRCTLQCRADQDINKLEKYWQSVTKIPKKYFYKARIDPRTIGKPTQKKDYKGVLRIDYLSLATQLDLENLAELVYNQLRGPEV